jgi:hypothetical protein
MPNPDDGNVLQTPMDVDDPPLEDEAVDELMSDAQPPSPSSKSSEPDAGFPFQMPPKKVGYMVQNCEDLRSYLKQDEMLYSAFVSRFGTNESAGSARLGRSPIV